MKQTTIIYDEDGSLTKEVTSRYKSNRLTVIHDEKGELIEAFTVNEEGKQESLDVADAARQLAYLTPFLVFVSQS